MKRIYATLLALSMTMVLAACGAAGNGGETTSTPEPPSTQEQEIHSPSPAPDSGNAPIDSPSEDVPSGEGSHILIAYFGVPETDGTDTVANASRVATEDGVVGNTQFIAQAIQQAVGGDLLRIETVEEYPLEHEALVDFAAEEQEAGARPALATQIENLEQYDTIFLGYPNWWGDMPQALYTFLESYDLSGKTIIPFCPHGGSGFSRTQSTIAELQPNATVREDGLTLSRNDVADSAEQVAAWAQGLGL